MTLLVAFGAAVFGHRDKCSNGNDFQSRRRGVEALFPIIYPPQVAILGFGTPLAKPWSVDGRLQTQTVMVASLAADHRVSDGHRGALLLQRIGEPLNTPEAMQ